MASTIGIQLIRILQSKEKKWAEIKGFQPTEHYYAVMGQSHFRSFRWLTVKIVIPIKQEFYQQKYPILQGF